MPGVICNLAGKGSLSFMTGTQLKNFLLIGIALLVGSCAVYDTKRGVFVTSTVQQVDLEAPKGEPPHFALLPFGAPRENLIGHATNANIISGIYLEVHFTYEFDDVDQNNLRASLVNSLNASGLAKVDDIRSIQDAKQVSSRKIIININKSGIIPGALISKCVIDAAVYLEQGNQEMKSARVSVEGTSALSISGAKNDAIQNFVEAFAKLIAEG